MRAALVRLVLALAALGLVGMHALGTAPPAEATATASATAHATSVHPGAPQHDDDGAPSHHGGSGGSAVECALLAGSAAAGLAVVVAALLGLACLGVGRGELLARLLALTRGEAAVRWWPGPPGPPVPATACVLRT